MKLELARVWTLSMGMAIFSIYAVHSQELDTANWLDGRIITIRHDTLLGKLQLSQRFIQIFSQESLRVFDPAQIRSYAFIDPDIGAPRYFSKYEVAEQLRSEFYEQLLIGKFHFIRKISEIHYYTYEANYLKSGKADDAWVPRKRQGLQGTYFLWDGHKLYKLGPFKSIMQDVSGEYWNELAKFATENSLNYGKPEHQAWIINHFNQLSLNNQASSD